MQTVTFDFAPLLAARAKMHMSRAELAAKIGVDYTTIWRWEKGRSDPNLRQLVRTSRALGVRMTDLFVVRT